GLAAAAGPRLERLLLHLSPAAVEKRHVPPRRPGPEREVGSVRRRVAGRLYRNGPVDLGARERAAGVIRRRDRDIGVTLHEIRPWARASRDPEFGAPDLLH